MHWALLCFYHWCFLTSRTVVGNAELYISEGHSVWTSRPPHLSHVRIWLHPTITVTFQNQQSHIYAYLTQWLVRCVEVRQSAGFELHFQALFMCCLYFTFCEQLGATPWMPSRRRKYALLSLFVQFYSFCLTALYDMAFCPAFECGHSEQLHLSLDVVEEHVTQTSLFPTLATNLLSGPQRHLSFLPSVHFVCTYPVAF